MDSTFQVPQETEKIPFADAQALEPLDVTGLNNALLAQDMYHLYACKMEETRGDVYVDWENLPDDEKAAWLETANGLPALCIEHQTLLEGQLDMIDFAKAYMDHHFHAVAANHYELQLINDLANFIGFSH